MLNIFNHGIVPIEAPPLNSPTDDMKIDENNDDILENKDHNLENSSLNGSTQLSHTSNINNKRPFSYIEGEVKRNKKRRGEIWDYTYNLREKGEKYEKSSKSNDSGG